MHVNQSKKIKNIETVTESGWKSTIKKKTDLKEFRVDASCYV